MIGTALGFGALCLGRSPSALRFCRPPVLLEHGLGRVRATADSSRSPVAVTRLPTLGRFVATGGVAFSAVAVASRRMASDGNGVTATQASEPALRDVVLKPVTNGAVSGDPVAAGTLWTKTGAVIFIVRRPG